MSRKGVRESDKPPYTMPASPAISAVLLECPMPKKRATPRPDCERQMMVHIRVSPTFQIESLDKFLLLDEVYDQKRQAKAKLMSPYLIEISRGEPVIMYPLQFAKSVRCDTCGHKNATSNAGAGTCNMEEPLAPLKTPSNNIAGGVHNDIGSVLPTNPLVPPAQSTGIHPPRSTQHEKRNQQQQFDDNEASMEESYNFMSNPSQKIESPQQQQQQQKLSVGIIDASAPVQPNQSPINVEECFPSSDLLFHDVDDNGAVYGMEYDADEYDERNMNYDTLTGRGGERDFAYTFRNKRLKTLPDESDDLPLNLPDPFVNTEKLFQQAEHKGEKARLETINAFKMKHPHLVGTVIGTSAVTGGAGSGSDVGYGLGSSGNAGKPHIAGIQEDSIRPQGEFDADGGDDSDVDVVGSRANGGQKQNLGSRMQSEYGHQLDDMETQKMSRPHYVAIQKSQSKWPDVQFRGSLHGLQGNARTQGDFSSNSNRQNAFPLSPKGEITLPSPAKGLRLWQLPQQRQEPDDSNDDSTRRRFPFIEDIDAQSGATGTSSGSNSVSGSNSGGSGVGSEVDYDRVDAPVRSVIESKSNNIAKIDDTGTAAGGMGDEFYWNTLNYPQGQDVVAKNDKSTFGRNTFNTFKIDGLDNDRFLDSSDHRTPKRLSNYNTRGAKSGHNGNSKLKKMMNRLRPQSRGSGADIGTGKIFHNNQRSGYVNFPRRTPSKKRLQDPPDKAKKVEARTRENFSDKSAIAAARMKIRSSDAAMGAGMGDTADVGDIGGLSDNSGDHTADGTGSGIPSDGPSGTYSSDSVIPAFPLNGYPGYLGAKVYSTYITPAPADSQYKLLENVPSEYLPDQPQFAKELGDPNLTVNDKINLLEVLSTHDEANDAILRKLENELDNSLIIHDLSNHDRMPIPSARASSQAKEEARKKPVQKRSYLMYDDLSMRDTYDQYDDLNIDRPVDEPLSSDEPISCGDSGAATACGDSGTATACGDSGAATATAAAAASCKSCDGRKCKTMGDKSCICDREGRHCKCTSQNMPKPGKKIRSVSDAWYSVFNTSAPLQFLTTRVGIYRKRHGVWWRIAPSITLTSLSGIYANANLSILFSSHVDIFQLSHPLSLKNHKLLIPRDSDAITALQPNTFESIDPEDILAIDSNKFDFNAINDDTDNDDNDEDKKDDASAKGALCKAAISAAERRRKRRSHSSSDAVLSIGDLGSFPGNMNILEQCPTDSKHLCLNLLDEEVPSFSVKIKQPFRENGLIFKGDYNVRIASVISDATTKGALQVAVVLVNEGYVPHEFAVCISNCPMTFGAKTTVKKDLAPHLGETISFLLPLEENKDTKLHCTVEPTARCLCIWDCDCHCIQDLVSHDDYNVCHKLDDYEEHAAGFIPGEGVPDQELTGWRWFLWRMNQYAFNLLLCMLFLGFLKAILGAIGLRRIDKYGYNYVQPLQKYEYASRCRRFFINIVFFVVLPFIFCCKCFTPTEEDLLIASTEWQCSVMQRDLSEDSSGEGGGGVGGGGGGGGWRPWKRSSNTGGYGHNASDNDDDDDDEETILSQRFESGEGSQGAGLEVSQSRFNEYLMNTCDYDEAEEERDTNYVLQALTESRESIRKLLNSHCSEDLDSNNPLRKEAEDLVMRLVAAKIVYRTFDVPLQNVDVPVGQKYSIRGYFVPSIGPGYQYFTPSPLAQLRRITANTSAILLPPVILRAEEFSRVYASKCEVLEAGDLSVDPPEDAPCISCSGTANESQLATEPVAAPADDAESKITDVTQSVTEQPSNTPGAWTARMSDPDTFTTIHDPKQKKDSPKMENPNEVWSARMSDPDTLTNTQEAKRKEDSPKMQ